MKWIVFYPMKLMDKYEIGILIIEFPNIKKIMIG